MNGHGSFQPRGPAQQAASGKFFLAGARGRVTMVPRGAPICWLFFCEAFSMSVPRRSLLLLVVALLVGLLICADTTSAPTRNQTAVKERKGASAAKKEA